MGTPQYIYLALFLIGTGISIAEHGQPRRNTNAWTDIIASGVVLALLAWGGFFG